MFQQACSFCQWKAAIKQYAVTQGNLQWQNSKPADWFTYHWEVAKVCDCRFCSFLG